MGQGHVSPASLGLNPELSQALGHLMRGSCITGLGWVWVLIPALPVLSYFLISEGGDASPEHSCEVEIKLCVHSLVLVYQ